jgi:hypothetical protein
MRAIETLKDIVGDRPVVMDREFSYLGFLQDLEAAQVSFVLRLNQGTHPKFQDSEGQKAVDRDVGYKGWSAFGSGVTPNPWEPEEALRMYLQRMKIDATFRDLKDLLGLERLMNRSQEYMEKMVALLYRAPRGGESEGFPVRAAAFGVEGTRRVSRPAGASQPGSPGHPFPGARESSGPAPAKPVALLRSVRTPHAEVVRDASAVAGHRPGGLGFLPGYPLSSCPNSCPNLRT